MIDKFTITFLVVTIAGSFAIGLLLGVSRLSCMLVTLWVIVTGVVFAAIGIGRD